jgi:CspA family cold shock protein
VGLQGIVSEPPGMPTGTVKWFDGAKGFGFIQPDQGNKDIFVHISAVEQAGLRGLNEGQKVSFEEKRDAKSGKMSAGDLKAV